MSLAIYIKIGPCKVPSSVVVLLGELGPNSIHIVQKTKDKGSTKGLEFSEDEEATLPKVMKSTRPLSPLIVPVHHPMRRKDNPTFPSLSGLQIPGLFGIRDDEIGFNIPHSKPTLKANATKAMATAGRHSAK